MGKVLVLDANQRSALATTRCLGKRGIHVVVADETARTLAGSSKYCREAMVYPSPVTDPTGFIATLRREVKRRQITLLLPMTDVTTPLILECRDQFPEGTLPYVPHETYEQATDKWQLYQLAKRQDVPTPMTHYIRRAEDLETIAQNLRFPAVLKPYRSRIRVSDGCVSASVKYATSLDAIGRLMDQHPVFREHPFLIQEQVMGEGAGLFALYDQGRPVVFFAHRRLREKPPSGGVSVLSESVAVSPLLQGMAQRLLDALQWHGVAMVEFKVAPDGTPYLIEINARFWGSLQLAVEAGVDFPWLLYQMGTGRPVDAVDSYQVGVRNRWLLGDLDRLYLVWKNPSNALSSKWKNLVQFVTPFERNVRYEVNRWDDFSPFIFELRAYVGWNG
jgi:predicted ATP-grasp superfamily ATP-dependent carboligase